MRHATQLADSAPRPLRLVILAVALFVATGPLCAYTIYLKDGTSFLAREKFKQQGSTALITLPSGAQTTLPIVQIDIAKTERNNATDFGNATVLNEPAPTPTPTQGRKGPSLAEIAAQRRVTPMPTRPPAPRPALTNDALRPLPSRPRALSPGRRRGSSTSPALRARRCRG